ncbi:MAG: MoxR family ATPase [Bacteroidota bacterium]
MSFKQYAAEGNSDLGDFSFNNRLNDPALYRPSEDLVTAVNVALKLGQPLLLTGEPGTGKTQLAYHVAHFFNLEDPLVFNAQTSSQVQDLFYTYDALRHFQFNQNNPTQLSRKEIEESFIEYQALGKAIKSKSRKVVLIDEIDKAPRDLPNDVLAAIENMEFRVAELGGEPIKAENAHRPIVIITSNSEKNLPDAFLRRVVYYHIPFPSPEELTRIVSLKVDGYGEEDLNILIDYFWGIRKDKSLRLKKDPATAELIFWVMLLKGMDFDPEGLKDVSSLSDTDKAVLRNSFSVLAKTQEDLRALKERVK